MIRIHRLWLRRDQAAETDREESREEAHFLGVDGGRATSTIDTDFKREYYG